jgi:hypothetical protein
VKSPQQVLADVERRLGRTWTGAIAGPASASSAGGGASKVSAGDPARAGADSSIGVWPHAFPIGQPTTAELTTSFPETVIKVGAWRSWAAQHSVTVQMRARRVHGTPQELPTHLLVPDVDTAAQLCGGDWPARLARARLRADLLRARYPHLSETRRVISATDSFTDVDFDLLCRAADWFASHDAAGLTPRQVPIEGLHAKWLNTRHGLLRELAAVDTLNLLPPHPARLHFTYLDPTHRAAGRRWHDSATVGDPMTPAYRPQIVIISENKDTAIHFPPLTGAISVEGVGRGGATAAAIDWLREAPAVFYWGDMDADGLEILDGFRAEGIAATSILMNLNAYETWERFGTNTDARGNPLKTRESRPVPHLTGQEAALYHRLINPRWERHRRVEQERIPLDVAVVEVRRHLGARSTSGPAR